MPPTNQKQNKNPKTWFTIAFAILFIVTIYPLLGLKYMPFIDYPEHLTAGAAIKDIFTGGPLEANFVFKGIYPNILGWMIIASLNLFFDILSAGKIFILLYFLITPLSVYYFLDDDKKSLSLLSFPFLNNFALNCGFINYLCAIPLLFFSLGAYKRKSKLFYPLTLMLYLAHSFSYGIFVVLLGIFYLTTKNRDRRKLIYSFLLLALIILPLFSFTSNLQSINKTEGVWSIGNIITYFFQGLWINLTQNLVYSFIQVRIDYYALIGFIAVTLIYAKQLFWDRAYEKTIFYSLIAIMLIILIFPPVIDSGGTRWVMYNGRLLTVLILMNLSDLRLADKHLKLLVIFFSVLTFASAATIYPAYHAADESLKKNFDPVLEKIPAGKKLFVWDETKYSDFSDFDSPVDRFIPNAHTTFFRGYYPLSGGYTNYFYGNGQAGEYWAVSYKIDLDSRVCRTNPPGYCFICDGEGVRCVDMNLSNVGLVVRKKQCAYCYAPLSIRCIANETNPKPTFYEEEGDSCIRCERQDITCIMNHPGVRKNFDYVVVFNLDGEVSKPMDKRVYYSTPQAVVYEVD